MTPELTALTLAALLQFGQFCIYSVTAQMQVGRGYALSPRDKPREIIGVAGRAQRALNNHFEGLILFSIAVFVTVTSDQSTQTTAACAWVYLGARILYVPAYLFGLSPWRSLIWAVGLAATVTMLIAALI